MANTLFGEPSTTFRSWYLLYPRKVNPRDAEKAWRQSLAKGATPEQIVQSTKAMMAGEWKGRQKEHIPYPASFLRAQSWSQDPRESFEIQSDEATAKDEATPNEHFCTACEVAHVWRHECLVWCRGDKFRSCPDVVNSLVAEIRSLRRAGTYKGLSKAQVAALARK